MIHNRDYKEVMVEFEDESFDGIFTDPPYNVSEKAVIGSETELVKLDGRRNIRKHMGDWDEGYSPEFLVKEAARVLVPGGWFVAFCSDRLIGQYNRLISEHLYYKATITWIKTNPVPQIRQSSFLSGTEYIVVGLKGEGDQIDRWGTPKGKKRPPVCWNWLGQQNMQNYFIHPICGGSERTYWHDYDGSIIRCTKKGCSICREKGKDDKQAHPAQKPMFAWSWFYRRLTCRGMRVLDPFCGLGSSGMAARMYGLEWTGIEIDPTYWFIATALLSGDWPIAVSESQTTQKTLRL